MIAARIRSGFANQLYAFINDYLLAKEYNQEIVLVIPNRMTSIDYSKYSLDLLNIPVVKKVEENTANSIKIAEKVYIPAEFADYEIILSTSFVSGELSSAAKGDKLHVCSSFDEVKSLVSSDKDYFIDGFWMDTSLWNCPQNKKLLMDLVKPYYESYFFDYFKKKISSEISVGVHVRQTKFSNEAWIIDVNGAYYRAAIQLYRKKYHNCKFYVFADNLEWAKREIGSAEDISYIATIGGIDNDIVEFLCLSLCDHKILSNSSTFSSLSFMLNFSKDKTKILFRKESGLLRYKMFYHTLLNYLHCDNSIYLDEKRIIKLEKNYKRTKNKYINKLFLTDFRSKKLETKADAIEWLIGLSDILLMGEEFDATMKQEYVIKKFEALIMAEDFGKALLLAERFEYLFECSEKFAKLMICNYLENEYYWSTVFEIIHYKMQYGDCEELVAELPFECMEVLKKIEKFPQNKYVIVHPRGVCRGKTIRVGELLRKLGNEVEFWFYTSPQYLKCIAPYPEWVNYQEVGDGCKQFAIEERIEKEKKNEIAFSNSIFIVRDTESMQLLGEEKKYIYWVDGYKSIPDDIAAGKQVKVFHEVEKTIESEILSERLSYETMIKENIEAYQRVYKILECGF